MASWMQCHTSLSVATTISAPLMVSAMDLRSVRIAAALRTVAAGIVRCGGAAARGRRKRRLPAAGAGRARSARRGGCSRCGRAGTPRCRAQMGGRGRGRQIAGSLFVGGAAAGRIHRPLQQGLDILRLGVLQVIDMDVAARAGLHPVDLVDQARHTVQITLLAGDHHPRHWPAGSARPGRRRPWRCRRRAAARFPGRWQTWRDRPS